MKLIKTVSFTLAVAALMSGCNQTADIKKSDAVTSKDKIEYPITDKGTHQDTYFGTQVADPYRWLEDDLSEKTGEWVRAQNKTTHAFLNKISMRDSIKQKLANKWNYQKVGAPFKEGKYSYYRKNDGLQNQYVIYRIKEDASKRSF
ncbi:MAG: hypothetical protein Q9M92_01170 [Enterobacterales bacterium]|nr:hypothetical protein [Enterobacterales bacterium]